MSHDLWGSYSLQTSQIELSEPDDPLGSVGNDVIDQCQVVAATPQSWVDIDTAVTIRDRDPVRSTASPAPEPANPHMDPERFPLVPLEVVANRPSAFGFVEVYERALDGQLAASTANNNYSSNLRGLRYARKDMILREGKLCEAGSPILSGFTAGSTASVLKNLDAAGALEIGRLHMAELALSPTGRNNWLGPGRNPWDTTRVSGGSSSGSGIAVATRAVDFALGSDTGGSVRIPAAACGVTGLKPTNGLLPVDGLLPLSPTLDCLGILAPGARTVAAVLEYLTGVSANVHLGSAGVTPTILIPDLVHTDPVDLEMIDAALRFRSVCAAAGYVVEGCSTPKLDRVGMIASLITSVEAASVWIDELRTDPLRFYLEIRRRIERGVLIPAPVYLKARRMQHDMTTRFLEKYIPRGSILALPTTPGEAPTIESSLSGTSRALEDRFRNYSYWTRAINYFGLPALSIPVGFGSHGLPLGMQLIGRPFSDPTLLRVAVAVQDRTEWHTMTPAMRE